MRIAFRVDASAQIGTGHVSRCLSLAGALQGRGAEVHFLCRQITPFLAERIVASGYSLHRLPDAPRVTPSPDATAHAAWLESSWEMDAQQCLEKVRVVGGVDLLVVDHYALDARWEKVLRPAAHRILVIDDLADRIHDADFLLDQNFYRDQDRRYQGLVPAACRCLLGPSYALLRPDFADARRADERGERPLSPVRRISVCFGGSDPTGELPKVLAALAALPQRGQLTVEVIVGSAAPTLSEVRRLAGDWPELELVIDAPDMAARLARADLGIGAAGSMSWERGAVGLPSIAIAVAANQVQLAEDAARAGMHLYLGKHDEVTADHVAVAVSTLLESPHLRQHFAEVSASLTDGRGLARVAQVVLPPEIRLRPVTLEDAINLHAWRNDPVNRRFSHNDAEIPWETHVVWLQRSLHNPDRVLLVGESTEGAVGVLRYDWNGEYWLTSVYLVPGRHGSGLGEPLLRAGLDWLQTNYPGRPKVRAEILAGNPASHAVFLRAGYHEYFTTYDVGS
jgi:UDP-2,4-diacetamido-2,4,6-trideoxy-beta-L-altropyranose hydrolase